MKILTGRAAPIAQSGVGICGGAAEKQKKTLLDASSRNISTARKIVKTMKNLIKLSKPKLNAMSVKKVDI